MAQAKIYLQTYKVLRMSTPPPPPPQHPMLATPLVTTKDGPFTSYILVFENYISNAPKNSSTILLYFKSCDDVIKEGGF